jgi:phenylalanyl-tRNA synthetase alpha subunit
MRVFGLADFLLMINTNINPKHLNDFLITVNQSYFEADAQACPFTNPSKQVKK